MRAKLTELANKQMGQRKWEVVTLSARAELRGSKLVLSHDMFSKNVEWSDIGINFLGTMSDGNARDFIWLANNIKHGNTFTFLYEVNDSVIILNGDSPIEQWVNDELQYLSAIPEPQERHNGARAMLERLNGEFWTKEEIENGQ